MFRFLHHINWSELSGLIVGAVLAIAISLAGFILMAKLHQEGVLGKKEYNLYCDLVSAQGLRKGTTVQINGVDIGRIEEVSLTPKGLVRLKLVLDSKYKQWITNRSVVYATRDQNIISERVVNVDISKVGDKILEDEDFLIAGTAQDIETVLKTANELIDKIGQLVIVGDTILKKIVDTNTTIGMLLGSRVLFNNLDGAVFRINRFISDADGLVSSMNDIMNPLSNGMPKVMAFADTLSTGTITLINSLDGLTKRADGVMNSLDTIVGDLGSVTSSAGNLIIDGSQALNRTDDVMSGVSKFWFLRSKIPQKDSIPLPEEEW